MAKKEGEPRCPKCQGELVQRAVKRGANAGREFFGVYSVSKVSGDCWCFIIALTKLSNDYGDDSAKIVHSRLILRKLVLSFFGRG